MIRLLIVFSILVTLVFQVGCNEGSSRGVGGGSIASTGSRVDVEGLRDHAVRIVRQGLGSENSYVRAMSIEVVSTTRRMELMPMVTELLDDKTVPVRFGAALAVGDTGYRAGEFAAIEMLDDADMNVRIAGAYALAKLGRVEKTELIRDALKSDNKTVRANSALLLGKLGNKSDIDRLYGLLSSAESADKEKLQVVESLAMLGDRRVFQSKLWPLLISKYSDDRIIGIRGMGALGTTDSRNAILTMLEDDILEVRLCAAEQLSRLGNRSGRAGRGDSGRGDLAVRFDSPLPPVDGHWPCRAVGLRAAPGHRRGGHGRPISCL